MSTDSISYKDTGYFTPLVIDYLEQKENLRPLYNRFPTLENFGKQIIDKQTEFPDRKREVLVSALKKQYANTATSDLTAQNISALADNNSFTVTTGHQLNLFTGPLYFLYKIISTINLTKELKANYPQYNFVPVYWMATEDHDFEEINHFNFKGKNFSWNKEATGPVGRLSTEGLDEVLAIFSMELGNGDNAEYIKKLFRKSYLEHETLAAATFYLANELFGKHGLVILEPDNADLKREFIPYIKEELLNSSSHQLVSESIKQLKGYSVQVNPRELNLFYIKDKLRERIVLENQTYNVHNTDIKFTQTEILSQLERQPEDFSPNVIMRPLYQEVILPNLCYIGGGGEIAYWLELKSFFNSQKISFPILLLRNSALLVTRKQSEKANRLGLSFIDLFQKQTELLTKKVKAMSDYPIDFTTQKETLRTQFEYLNTIAEQTDKSFTGAVKAQEAKQIKGLEQLEKRFLKAQKRKFAEQLERTTQIQDELFPNQGLQERQANFSEYFIEYNDELINQLLSALKPLEEEFNIIVL